MAFAKLFGEEEIAKRVEELAAEIAAAVSSSSGDLTVIGVLIGSFVFVADLARALDRAGLAPRVDFIRLNSYGDGQESSGAVALIGEPPKDVAGKRVLLVDDIADTGRTMVRARELLVDCGAAEILTCVLVDKPSRRRLAFSADFTGFSVGDVFVVGYGLDAAEQYRHLPYLGRLL